MEKLLKIIEISIETVLILITVASFAAVIMGHTHQLLVFVICLVLSIVTIKEKREENNV